MSPQLYAYSRFLRAFFAKHHPIIFVSTICIAIGLAVLSLSQVLSKLNEASNVTPTSTIQGFDDKTVDKIKQLRISSDGDETIELPSPRANPFVE